ncbi:MAG: alcohol dehydrogenase catalytic domain-containing protein [Bryobacteraceae bacterium]
METREMPMPPDPGRGEVLVRLRAVGICGSDMHWYKEGGIGSFSASYPQVLGHEPAGEVAAVGKGVTGLQVGQKVAVEPAICCGHCEFCMTGHHNNCVNSIFMGSSQMPGLFREYAVMPVHNAVAVPDSMSFDDVTVLEPLSVILHIMEMTPVRLGDTVAVMGAGPIGLLTAMVARLAGASRIMLADRVAHRVKRAKDLGFDCIDTSAASMTDAVMDQTRARGVDISFDAAAASDTYQACIDGTRLGGRVVLIGIPSEKAPHFDIHMAMHKELNIQTVKRSNHNIHAAIELMKAGLIGSSIVSHRYPLEQTPLAFETLAEYADGVCKTVIELP